MVLFGSWLLLSETPSYIATFIWVFGNRGTPASWWMKRSPVNYDPESLGNCSRNCKGPQGSSDPAPYMNEASSVFSRYRAILIQPLFETLEWKRLHYFPGHFHCPAVLTIRKFSSYLMLNLPSCSLSPLLYVLPSAWGILFHGSHKRLILSWYPARIE